MELNEAIKITIQILQENSQEDDDLIIKKLIGLGIEEPLANRLLNFITTAFCMVMYENSDLNFPYSYFFFDGKRNISASQLLIDEPVFAKGYKIAREKINKDGVSEAYLSVASRDAGYKVIQQFIESGSDLENVELAPMGIYNSSYFYNTKKWWEIWK